MTTSNPRFESTILSMIIGVAGKEPKEHYLRRFVDHYGGPLRSYLVRSLRLSPEFADDVLQDFMIRKFLSPNSAADDIAAGYLNLDKQSTGTAPTFRAYLLRSLKNFAIDQLRKSRQTVPIEGLEPVSEPQEQFEVDWATNLLRMAIEGVREDCEIKQQTAMWEIFEARFLLPVAKGEARPSLIQLARCVGLENAKMARNRLETMKRKFRVALQKQIADYLPLHDSQSDATFEKELADLVKTAAKLNFLHTEQSSETRDPISLFQLLDKDTCAEEYSEADCADLWRCLSESTVQEFASEVSPRLAPTFHDMTYWGGSPLVTVSDLWSHTNPPLELLQAIKIFGKKNGRVADALTRVYPRAVCIALYHGAIASAWIHHETRITADTPETILSRLPKVLGTTWFDPSFRSLLMDWESVLKADLNL